MKRKLAAEFDTIGFLLGYLLVVAGVAQFSVRVAFIVAGIVLCLLMAAVAIDKAIEKRRRRSAS